MKSIVLLFLLAVTVPCFAQQQLPVELSAVCRTWGISFPEHQDKSISIEEGSVRFGQQFEIEVSDKKEDYQMTAYFIPHADLGGKENPVVHSMMRATHFASNEGESPIAVHALDSSFVHKEYGADWGQLYYFQPKKQLSLWENCQMVALEQKEKGIFYVFYFFDKLSDPVEEMIWNPKFTLEN